MAALSDQQKRDIEVLSAQGTTPERIAAHLRLSVKDVTTVLKPKTAKD